MTVYSVTSETQDVSRYGFIVAKTVGNAVVRNRVRRRLKAICRAMSDTRDSGDAAYDLVFRAHPPAASATFADLEHEAISLVNRAARGEGRRG